MVASVKIKIAQLATSLGFDICKFTKASLPNHTSANLQKFVELDRHGEMGWIEDTLERRRQPTAMWRDAKSAIVLGFNYGPDSDPLEILEQKNKAAISVYAQNRDYHEIIKGRLKQIAQKIASQHKCEVKVFVDTAPLMEKPLAAQAGVGWQGKHTNLVSRELGSWLFLGTILTTLEMEPDAPELDHCGSCTSCLDICPTNAFPAPYQLDARKCISYLTIEYSGAIPTRYRKAIGNRVYGCDDCLAVCPWNKFAQTASEAKLQARDDLKAPLLAELIVLDDEQFRKHFSGSPIKRIGRDKFIRNILIAAGNSNDVALLPFIEELLSDQNETVRGSAVWAFSQLATDRVFGLTKQTHLLKEQSSAVIAEWQQQEIL